MHKLTKIAFTFLLMVFLQGAFSCKEQNPDPPVTEEGKITAVLFDFLAEGKGKQDVSIQFRDNDGLNGKQSSSPLRFQANTTYNGKITLLDESQTPAKDVSSEYSITYRVTGAAVTINRTNQQLRLEAGAATTSTDGLLRIELKKNTNVINVSFPILISQ